jgi:outer membrane receptor protein involved in Fe transport
VVTNRPSLKYILAAVSVAALPAVAAETPGGTGPTTSQLEEIVVTASFRNETLAEIPVSVTVLPERVLHEAGLQHFADVLGLVPNLNWSGGTSRPRYFQLRGIGELEQYQGAPNPSVGFLIDEIDFSGVGMPATLFDVDQVEVLRGPQGTRYGANALAGLIKVKTRDPDGTTDLRTEVTVGDDGVRAAGIAVGGALGSAGDGDGWRLVAQDFTGDGFRHNAYLNRNDTNGRDESTLRGKLRLHPADAWQVDIAGLYVDLDNGFDAFSLDNSLRTLSDRPGRDAQRSRGASVSVQGDLGAVTLQSATAYADSDIVYSFDGDWANDSYWGAYAPYDYYSRYGRNRRTVSEDLRVVSRASADDGGHGWIAGVYALRLDESNDQRDYFAMEPLHDPLLSQYSATSVAAYVETEWKVMEALTLSGGLRAETRSSDYHDSEGTRFAPRDDMWGGQLSLRGPLFAAGSWYATVSRGYKAGGFNIGKFVPQDSRQFAPEYLWNVESGVRLIDDAHALEVQFAVFSMWREQQQVAMSFQLDPGDPLSYVFYTDNAARGRNSGIEASLTWQPLPVLSLAATLGLLHSEYLDYVVGDRNLDGRSQAHAPGYQYSLSAHLGRVQGWMARADLTGCDAFYFDTSHDQRSKPYTLVNLKAGFAGERWSAYAWGRNVFDTNYAVRGFYFGLEPPDFADKLYIQRGDPRSAGVTIEWRLR